MSKSFSHSNVKLISNGHSSRRDTTMNIVGILKLHFRFISMNGWE